MRVLMLFADSRHGRLGDQLIIRGRRKQRQGTWDKSHVVAYDAWGEMLLTFSIPNFHKKKLFLYHDACMGGSKKAATYLISMSERHGLQLHVLVSESQKHTTAVFISEK